MVSRSLHANLHDQRLKVARLLGNGFGLVLEHVMRNGVNLIADALQRVSSAVDHRFDQAKHRHLAGGAGLGAFPLRFHRIGQERTRFGVAHRHQRLALQNEGNRRFDAAFGFDIGNNGHGHELRTVLAIQPVRKLDLGHFCFGRNFKIQSLLDKPHFFHGGIKQIQPKRIGALQRFQFSNCHKVAVLARIDPPRRRAPSRTFLVQGADRRSVQVDESVNRGSSTVRLHRCFLFLHDNHMTAAGRASAPLPAACQ